MWRTLWPRGRTRTSSATRNRGPARFRPRIEVLEGRCLPSTLTVTSTADSGPGSLRAELATAKSGDTIVFDPSLDGQTITLTSGLLDIKKSVTIQGPGAGLLTISGDNLSQVFQVDSHTTVSLSGMTLTGGNAPFSGGAIEDLGNLTLSNCTVTGNSAFRDGGAIDVRDPNHGKGLQATLTVDNCTISNNSAPFGGAISVGGFAPTSVGSATIENSTLSGNSSTFGGVVDNVGNLTISGSTLSGNTAAQDGGAIFNEGMLTVSGSTLSGNTASIQGGAIFSSPASLPYALVVSGSNLSMNSASSFGGGAIFIGGGPATISTSFFCGNTPDNISGSYTDGGGNTFC